MGKPSWLEPLEQAGHFFMGLGARIVFLDYLLWRREAVTQWPPGKPFEVVSGRGTNKVSVLVTQMDRVEDMVLNDMRWYQIGGIAGDVIRLIAGVAFYLYMWSQ